MRSVHELDGGVVVAEVLDHELSVHRVDSSINLRVVRVWITGPGSGLDSYDREM